MSDAAWMLLGVVIGAAWASLMWLMHWSDHQ